MRKPIVAYSVFTLFFFGLSLGGWWFYRFRVSSVPPPEQSARAVARIIAAPQISSAPNFTVQPELPSPQVQATEPPRFMPKGDPLKEFDEYLKAVLLKDLALSFRELQTMLSVPTTKSSDPSYVHVVMQLLDSAEQHPEKRAELYLAADLVAGEVWCDMEKRTECESLRSSFARYHLTLDGDGLGGVFVYTHDLLWRVWQDYPETEWGERAFVLILERGWDTWPGCSKGSDQFRDVIQHGEEFLAQRPKSGYRAVVLLLVGEAYTTWWSLSKDVSSDYVDPNKYQVGSEEALNKSIAYFEEVAQIASGTKLADYAMQVLAGLRERRVVDPYWFYCVYD